MSFSRRRFLATTAAAGMLPALGPLSAWADAAPPVARGGRITASMDLEPISLHPLFGNAPTTDRFIFNQIFDALLRIEQDGTLSPALATEWSYGADNRSITLTLREGVRFHDGEPFDAEAAKINLDFAVAGEGVAPHRADMAEIDSVEVLGPLTIRMNLKNPSGAILAVLGTEPCMMTSPKALAEQGEAIQRNPVGTGPFRFVRWLPGEFIETERFDGYWRMGEDGQPLPYLDALKMRFISNNATKVIELQGGNLDLGDAITPRDAQQLMNDSRIKILTPPGGIQSWLAFNSQRAPFDNVHLRRAVNAGIDRAGLLQAVSLGIGDIPPVMFASTEWAFNAEPGAIPFDPDLARREVELSGLGPRVQATLSVIQRDPDVQLSQIIQAMLAQVGIDLQITVLERSAWVQGVLAGDYQVGMGRWSIPFVDPDQVCRSVLGRGALNWANIQDADLRQLSVEAAQVVDHAERRALYQQIQAQLVDQAYYDFLMMRGVNYLSNPALYGLTFEPNGLWHLSTAYLAA